MRAHDILCGVDLLTARPDVDAHSIRAFARGVKGVWLLLAAASCRKIGKVWLDRSPYSLRVALQNSMAADLVKAMGSRPVVWTDRTNWMRRVVALGPGFRYRYVLGDATDLADAQDDAYIRELLSSTEEALL